MEFTNLLSYCGSHLLVLEPFLYVYVTALRVYAVYAHIGLASLTPR